MNQTASLAGASEATAPPPSTGAMTPATTQAVKTTTAPTGPSPGANTSQGNSVWGKGLLVNATQHIPGYSDTTAEAMTAVMEALPCRAAEELNESVLDENAEFVMSRLNHHEPDVRAERTEAMSELVQRINAIDVTCLLQNLKDVLSETELAGTRAFSLKGAGNTMFTVPAEFMTRHLIPLMILNKTLADTLLSSSPKSGEVSPEWDSVNVPSFLTTMFGDLRMRTSFSNHQTLR
jgi:hypothetical protein